MRAGVRSEKKKLLLLGHFEESLYPVLLHRAISQQVNLLNSQHFISLFHWNDYIDTSIYHTLHQYFLFFFISYYIVLPIKLFSFSLKFPKTHPLFFFYEFSNIYILSCSLFLSFQGFKPHFFHFLPVHSGVKACGQFWISLNFQSYSLLAGMTLSPNCIIMYLNIIMFDMTCLYS